MSSAAWVLSTSPPAPLFTKHACTHTLKSPMRHHYIGGGSSKPRRGSTEALPPKERICQKTPDSWGTHHTAPVLWQLHVMGLKEVIWTSEAGEELFLMAAGLHNQSHWLSCIFPRHPGVQSLLFPWSPERRVYDLGSAASFSFSASPSSRGWPVLQSHIVRAEGSWWNSVAGRDPGAGSRQWQYHRMGPDCSAPSTPALLTGR